MGYIQRIIEKYREKQKNKKSELEEDRKIRELNRILDQKLPVSNIVKCENYLYKVEYFLMEFSPYAMTKMLKQGIETSCKFIQLTGDDAGEVFNIPKPCFLSQQKNNIPAYFLLNNNENLSIAVNTYANYDIDSKLNEDEMSQTITLQDVIIMRDNDNDFIDGNSIDFKNDKFVVNLIRLDECSSIVKRKHNEIGFRKG